MSHYHLEIVMPPTDDVQKAVEKILAPFDEDNDEASGPFWDFWVIGGRWSGEKLTCALDKTRMDAFFRALSDKRVTVHGLTCGKQEISPASQIPMVDALWREFFPDSPLKVCPLFRHFNDQYAHSTDFPDVMPLKDVPVELTAERVIIVGPDLQPASMLQQKFWNGVSWIDAKWDGKLTTALVMHRERLKGYRAEYAKQIDPQPDWLVITVDYHS
jgi:hypothetical protein